MMLVHDTHNLIRLTENLKKKILYRQTLITLTLLAFKLNIKPLSSYPETGNKTKHEMQNLIIFDKNKFIG